MEDHKIEKIKAALKDDQSRVLMDARIEFLRSGDEFAYYKSVDSVVDTQWHCPGLEQAVENLNAEGIIVFGCGHDGRETKRVLDLCKINLDFFVDSDCRKVGTKIEGVEVISIDDVVNKCKGYLVILGSRMHYQEMRQTLLSKEFPPEHILQTDYVLFQACTGNQYFDVFEPKKDEIFIDAGAYDGATIRDFVNWTKGEYKKIIALEPLAEMCNHIKEKCTQEHIRSVQIEEAAAWNKKEKLFFAEAKAGSRVEEGGETCINGIDIDSIAKDEMVTFIKMDIEGSELKALEGAKDTIQRNKPRLAICIYHKPEDIIELPSYILELVPEYKFYIRHYRSNICETVLYAMIEEAR